MAPWCVPVQAPEEGDWWQVELDVPYHTGAINLVFNYYEHYDNNNFQDYAIKVMRGSMWAQPWALTQIKHTWPGLPCLAGLQCLSCLARTQARANTHARTCVHAIARTHTSASRVGVHMCSARVHTSAHRLKRAKHKRACVHMPAAFPRASGRPARWCVVGG